MSSKKRKLSVLLSIIAAISLILAVGGPRVMASVVPAVTGEQATTVRTAGDQAHNLEINAAQGTTESDRFNSDGTLDLSLTGLNYVSVVQFDDVFRVSNIGSQPIHITITKLDNHEITGKPENNPESDRLTFYIDANGNQQFDGDPRLDGQKLAAGESVAVSIQIDLRGFKNGDDSDNGLPGVDDLIDELIITASSVE